MVRYRNKIEIVADILRSVSNGALKTHIMYSCNLSYKLLRQYITDVMKADLVSKNNRNYYVITKKGRVFLSKFEDYVRHSEKVNKKIDEIDQQREFLENMILGGKPKRTRGKS